MNVNKKLRRANENARKYKHHSKKFQKIRVYK